MADNNFSKQLTLLDVKTQKEEPLPEKIGPYVIEDLIAKSHYSIIYLGYHPENRQVVALKVLSPDFVEKKAMVSSLINEGHIIQMASHPNIVKLFDQGKWEGGLYLAMEFIRGVSLRQFIQQHSLSLKRCLDIVLQVCYALCHLHAYGIIHGDLKPENILITEDGEVKVLDFGIAKRHDDSSSNLSLAGTPSYMSPEHKISVDNLTYSSDIYSLGIIAYELITGKISYGVISLDHIPQSLRPIIAKCINKSLDERYGDVVDLIHDLSLFFKKELIQDKIQEPVSSSLEIDMVQALQDFFPIPKLYCDPLDLAIMRNQQKKFSHPILAYPFNDGGCLLGILEGHSDTITQSLEEAKAMGFIQVYLAELLSKKFSLQAFIQKLNSFCFDAQIKLNFCFVFMDGYYDEVQLSHGGILAPIMSKNKKLFAAPVTLSSSLLGTALDPLPISTHALEIDDQMLIHSLKLESQLKELLRSYQSFLPYSAQMLAESLIKKTPPDDLHSLICFLKVK